MDIVKELKLARHQGINCILCVRDSKVIIGVMTGQMNTKVLTLIKLVQKCRTKVASSHIFPSNMSKANITLKVVH